MAVEGIPNVRIPVSTYRLQFSSQFRFSDARDIIRYLHDLGITDIYASPYLKAKEGSLHGYDIVDPNELNPEIGTEEEYDELIKELQKYGMGQILDIVPNHMCIASKENTWWMDVLENGQSSVYANFFDINWDPIKKELKDKVLLPILGDQYGTVLENQELQLSFEEGSFFINYYEHRLPVRSRTYTNILKYGLNGLKKQLPGDNPYLIELLAIITALNSLPRYTERNPEKIRERYSVNAIIKKRLFGLYNKSNEIRAFIDRNVEIFNGVKGEPRSFDLLDKLLREQVYRLSHWRVAAEEINYRRFFDINELAAIRMEDPVVFNETHKLIFRLIKEGSVTGLRVDHPDGLYNPTEYFHRLQQNCFLHIRLGYLELLRDNISQDTYEAVKGETPMSAHPSDAGTEILKQYDEVSASNPYFKPFYIVGEKILTRDEEMPEDWPIFSTTGYVFLNSLNGIFIKTGNAKAFDEIYSRFIRSKINFQDIVYEKKKLIMQAAMASEINTLGHHLSRISEKDRHTRDFTLNSLIGALVEVIAFFPVYRTYITPPLSKGGIGGCTASDKDQRYIELAVSKARRRNPAISGSIFDFLKNVLLLNYPEHFKEDDRKEWLNFVMRFQQITGAVMAKGVEDTAFYVYNRLVSINEVGGSPDRFGTSLETFHGKNIERIKSWPHALIATSTHDSKRSEDVRARINVLSEIPDEWKGCLISWNRLNKKKRPVVEGMAVPDRNEEYLLYQTLVGAWPVELMNESEYEVFKNRIKDYMLKTIREAKVNTSWINPNTIYEDAMMIFIERIMDLHPNNKFLRDFLVFQKKVSDFGMFNSLSQTLLKITSPGVPDFYQGTEIWNFSLVDPDNRRPVDYKIRMEMLEELKERESDIGPLKLLRELTANKDNGKIKMYLIYKSLNFRNSNRELFEKGEYIPLEVYGDRSDNVCAFVRRTGNRRAVTVVPRFLTGMVSQTGIFPFDAEWNDSFIVIPFEETGARYRNIFTDEIVTAKDYKNATILKLSEVFSNSPVVLLERIYN